MNRNAKCRQIISCIVAVCMVFLWMPVFADAASVVPTFEAGSIPSGTIYCLKNVGSGKYLNVDNGIDADNTNVYQWTKDGSVEQRFRLVYNGSSGWYYIESVTSTTNRCLHIVKSGTSIAAGCNIVIYTKSGANTQRFYFESAGPQQVYIHSYTEPNLVIGAYGNSNGSANGRSSTSAGNVCLQTYTGDDYQKWTIEPYNATPTIAAGQYYIKNLNSGRYLTANTSTYNVSQKAKTGANTQKWNVYYEGNGYYTLQPVSNPDRRLDIYNAWDESGTNVQIHTENGNDAQKYRIISSGSGSYRLAPANSATRVLDVASPYTTEDANVQISVYEALSRQKWVFEPTGVDYYSLLNWSWVFANNQYTTISSGYHTTARPSHHGIDVAAVNTEPTIISPTSGTVQKRMDNDIEGGHAIILRTNNRDPNGEYIRVAFLHMVSGSSSLQTGNAVSKGGVIGRVGNTGNSRGAHLHLSMFNGKNQYGSWDWPQESTSINPQRFFPSVNFSGEVSNQP